MDVLTNLIAPNEAILKTGFIQLGIVLVLFLVAGLKRSTAKTGLPLWAKMNAPLVSLIFCEAWVAIAYFAFRVVDSIDAYLVVGIWMAGGTSLISSLLKDISDGSVKVTSPADIDAMRRENPSKGGIGG